MTDPAPRYAAPGRHRRWCPTCTALGVAPAHHLGPDHDGRRSYPEGYKPRHAGRPEAAS